MALFAGIDEAGRGSVLGSLIICCAFCKRGEEKRLRSICKKDSKQLTPAKRQEIYDKLKSFCSFRWVEVTAQDLNTLMKTMSLNDIEAKAMADLAKKLKDADVMIDMPDRYSWTFRKRMERFGATRFEAEHKADVKYPIVAAASICAKLIRDSKMAEIRAQVGDVGSGYPSDQKTINALKNKELIAALTPHIRMRWKTLDNINQKKLFEGSEQ
jgi:ribonuclease HII